MILVDTSAWVEFLRGTGSAAHLGLKRELARGSALAWTEVVAMELLAGARDDADRARFRRLLLGLEALPVDGLGDHEAAADIYRACRRGGETPRKLTDCLIAAVAIRNGAEVLAADADFAVIARHTPLLLHRL